SFEFGCTPNGPVGEPVVTVSGPSVTVVLLVSVSDLTTASSPTPAWPKSSGDGTVTPTPLPFNDTGYATPLTVMFTDPVRSPRTAVAKWYVIVHVSPGSSVSPSQPLPFTSTPNGPVGVPASTVSGPSAKAWSFLTTTDAVMAASPTPD